MATVSESRGKCVIIRVLSKKYNFLGFKSLLNDAFYLENILSLGFQPISSYIWVFSRARLPTRKQTLDWFVDEIVEYKKNI